jgi:hypothetical protein
MPRPCNDATPHRYATTIPLTRRYAVTSCTFEISLRYGKLPIEEGKR